MIFKKVRLLMVFFLTCSKMFLASAQDHKGSASFTVTTSGAILSDTLWLEFRSCEESYGETEFTHVLMALKKNEKYEFELKDVKFPVTARLKEGSTDEASPVVLKHSLFLENGDMVTATVAPVIGPDLGYVEFNGSFQGKGSEKLNCFHKINRLHGDSLNEKDLPEARMMESIIRPKMKVLESYKGKISNTAYSMIGTDILCKDKATIYNFILKSIVRTKRTQDGTYSHADLMRLREFDIYLRIDFLKAFPVSQLVYSETFPDYYFRKLQSQIWLEIKTNDRKRKIMVTTRDFFKQSIDSAKQNYSGLLREKLILHLFNWYRRMGVDSVEEIISDAKSIITHEPFKSNFEELVMSMPGRKATNFRLPDVTGKYVSLDQFRGKIVFVDFWWTGCTGCAVYYKGTVKQVEHDFKSDSSIVFITISTDTNKDTWKKSIASGNYTSPEIINLYTEGKGLKHDLARYYNIRSAPIPILIDQNGIMRYYGSSLRGGSPKNLTSAIEKLKSELKNSQQ